MTITVIESVANTTIDDSAVEIVSVDSAGVEGNSRSNAPSISTDGRYVTFYSEADNLVAGDTRGVRDIFVHDRDTVETTRVSLLSDGTQANNHSYNPAISASGRYVSFESEASNLWVGDANLARDIFVHDRDTGETTRISLHSDGTPGNDGAYRPSISTNGRYITFDSDANNLVDGDTNSRSDVFVHDLDTGVTTRVSLDSTGTQGNSTSIFPSISGDGRYVTFSSSASNLVASDTNGQNDVFVHDRVTGETTRVSLHSDTTQGNSGTYAPSISTNGRYITFDSDANNLVDGDTNSRSDVFVHDLDTGETTRVSVHSDGTQGNSYSSNSSITDDGRYVTFQSVSTNLVDGDTSGNSDTFVHDRVTGETIRVSVDDDGSQVPFSYFSGTPALSENGIVTYYLDGQIRTTDLATLASNEASVEGRSVTLTFNAGSATQLTINWGDGSMSVLTPVAGIVEAQHIYDANGVYSASVTDSGAAPSEPQLEFSLHMLDSVSNVATGSAGTDIMHGHAGNDTLSGSDGNDILDGGTGVDTLLGGIGDDRIIFGVGDRLYADGAVQSSGGEGYDTAVLGEGFVYNTSNWGIYGFEAVEGNDSDNIINGRDDSVDYNFQGGGGSDTITTAGGNDTLDGSAGNDAMLGGAGDDRIIFGVNDRLYTDGAVRSSGGADYDTAVLGEGFSWNTYNWSIYGFEAVEGNELDNIINGRDNSIDYHFQGGGGDDTITTAGGRDRLEGGSGNDVLDGGTGLDLMFGEAGDDRITFAIGDHLWDWDSMTTRGDGGDDYDTAVLDDGFTWNTYNWSIYGFEAVEGNDLDNIINGRDNSVDYNFQGSGGNDTITTAGGTDTLIGGTGSDTLTGGSDADIFEFGSSWGEDTITDWSFAEGDILRFNTVTGLTQFNDLTITYGTDAEVAFGSDTITLTGITSGLTSGDFDFI